MPPLQKIFFTQIDHWRGTLKQRVPAVEIIVCQSRLSLSALFLPADREGARA
jgi:hypothetical protein